ncbi:hypothetical protein [Engelhardtia mirabilis]|uniref:Uncharacterized protein n=1 Tax=Engelhardtia mirabilis TaxID=2528011 RepID=A0A518BEQ1_9BACT|nr:hypothetical protein Pla133_04970 [Planctomycetes bacterium Pla133]QDU99758.1 hypothetical protein Pla86_04970 [Planctomycetes bacterium Pla86]
MGEPEFYVGYLPRAPRRLARFVRALVIALVATSVVFAALMAGSQGAFSNGAFEFGVERDFTGWIETEPYPMLVVERPGGGWSTYLLSGVGKHGAESEVGSGSGYWASLRGSLIYRDGQTMIEVSRGSVVPQVGPDSGSFGEPAGDAGSGSASGAKPQPDLSRIEGVGGERTFVGEIVDSKCFLGVMKPGATKPHRACATRCISGGVPPVLLVRDGDGVATYLLLVDETGASVGRQLVDRALIAEPVRVHGKLDQLGDRWVLRADPSRIERIE